MIFSQFFQKLLIQRLDQIKEFKSLEENRTRQS